MQMQGDPQWLLRAYTAENIYFYLYRLHLQEHTKGKQATHKNPKHHQKKYLHAYAPRTRFVICH